MALSALNELQKAKYSCVMQIRSLDHIISDTREITVTLNNMGARKNSLGLGYTSDRVFDTKQKRDPRAFAPIVTLASFLLTRTTRLRFKCSSQREFSIAAIAR